MNALYMRCSSQCSSRARAAYLRTGLDVGNCETGGFVSTLSIDDDGDGGSFVLRDLRRAPYCDGEAVTGELAGCFRYRPFF